MRHFLLLALCATTLHHLPAQDCTTLYAFFKKGTTLEYTNYDKKDQVASVMTQTVGDVRTNQDSLIADVSARMTDAKGQETAQYQFPVRCLNGTLYMDMRTMVPNQGSQPAGSGMTMQIDGTDLIFPADLQPGQTLPDAEMQLQMFLGELRMANTRYALRNRKVEAAEKVTTPASTFDCLKISYDLEYRLMGQRTVHCDYWLAKTVGMIKTISYDKKGQVESRMELTKLQR